MPAERNVTQLQKALDQILRQHGQVTSHDYDKGYLLIEVDMIGRPCGYKAEFASKGNFAKQHDRHRIFQSRIKVL